MGVIHVNPFDVHGCGVGKQVHDLSIIEVSKLFQAPLVRTCLSCVDTKPPMVPEQGSSDTLPKRQFDIKDDDKRFRTKVVLLAL